MKNQFVNYYNISTNINKIKKNDKMKTKAAVLRERGKSIPYFKSKPLSIEELDLDHLKVVRF